MDNTILFKGSHRGYMGSWGYIGVLEKKMETTILVRVI